MNDPLSQAKAEHARRQALAAARAESQRRQEQASAQQPSTSGLDGFWENGSQTGLLGQAMSGVNEGLARAAGAPVDLATGVLNLGVRGVNGLIGSDIPPINSGFGGSDTMESALAPTISSVAPENMAERYGRRVGQEVGATAIPAGATLRAAKAPLMLGGIEAASAIGAGVAGQTSQEIAPGNETADMIASLLGGMSPIAAARSMRQGPQAPTLDELKARQGSAYDAVDASQSQLTPQATQRLQSSVGDRAAKDGMDPFLAPKASRTSEKINTLLQPRISEVEKTRRLVGRDVAGAVDPTERAIGTGMKDEITKYLDNLQPSDVTSGDPSAAVASLREGRDMTQRIKKSEEISNLIYKGENRAATSGTGGNEVNAMRQNIRGILDNPKKRRGYSKPEIEAMEQIVRGSPSQNVMRALGRFSPTSGTLPAMAGIGAGTTLGPLGAIPSAVGLMAKGGAESLTKKSVSDLDRMIRNGGPLASKTANSDDARAMIAALLAQQSSAAP